MVTFTYTYTNHPSMKKLSHKIEFKPLNLYTPNSLEFVLIYIRRFFSLLYVTWLLNQSDMVVVVLPLSQMRPCQIVVSIKSMWAPELVQHSFEQMT